MSRIETFESNIEPLDSKQFYGVKWLITIALSLMAVCILIILYWLYSVPDKALVVKPSPITVATKTVSPGGYVLLHYDFCKNVTADGRVIITLVNSKSQTNLPTTTERSPKGCYSNLTAPFPIPNQTVAGTYHITFRTTYKVNPLRSIVQQYDTQSFVVK